MDINDISNEYIRGLIEGEGSFTFHTGRKKSNGQKTKMPAFVVSMHIRDKDLLNKIKQKLGLKNKLYYRVPRITSQNPKTGVRYLSERQAILVVRDFIQLKDIIIPFFYKKLIGYKGVQFVAWLEKIGSDSDISDRYKSLYHLYKWGAYDKLPKFTERFRD